MHNFKFINRLAEKFPLLAKGGNTGKIIISKDWSENPLGEIEQWPSELITSLGILLYSRVPMFLLWGPQFILFFNDAYHHLTDCKEHKSGTLGIPAKEAQEEEWMNLEEKIVKAFNGNLSEWINEDLISKIAKAKIFMMHLALILFQNPMVKLRVC